MDDLEVRGETVTSANPAVQLDFGGYAKGYALDRAAVLLREAGIRNALVDIGGNLMALGWHGERPWRIAIEAPRGNAVLSAMYFAGDEEPFAQEMVLVFLGAVATIYLTAALLNRQTELELRKEGRVIVLQQKSDIYMACIELVAKIAKVRQHDPELIDELHVLSHKLAVIGSVDVVAFEQVLNRIHAGLIDGRLSNLDSQAVMNQLAEVTAAMREDILQEVGLREAAKALAAIRRRPPLPPSMGWALSPPPPPCTSPVRCWGWACGGAVEFPRAQRAR